MKIYENLDLNDLDGEVWKVIDDFPDYSVSNLGRVKSFMRYHGMNIKIIKQYKDKDNYLYVRLYKNKKSKIIKIHRLVYTTFKEKLDSCYDTHHKDEDRENNFVDNLESKLHYNHIIDHRKGKKHSEKTISIMSETKKGNNNPFYKKRHLIETIIKIIENNQNNKLSNQDIYDIRKSLELKLYTPKQLSWMFDISIGQISRIKNRKRWCFI